MNFDVIFNYIKVFNMVYGVLIFYMLLYTHQLLRLLCTGYSYQNLVSCINDDVYALSESI